MDQLKLNQQAIDQMIQDLPAAMQEASALLDGGSSS
jgi:hypothetical protein